MSSSNATPTTLDGYGEPITIAFDDAVHYLSLHSGNWGEPTPRNPCDLLKGTALDGSGDVYVIQSDSGLAGALPPGCAPSKMATFVLKNAQPNCSAAEIPSIFWWPQSTLPVFAPPEKDDKTDTNTDFDHWRIVTKVTFDIEEQYEPLEEPPPSTKSEPLFRTLLKPFKRPTVNLDFRPNRPTFRNLHGCPSCLEAVGKDWTHVAKIKDCFITVYNGPQRSSASVKSFTGKKNKKNKLGFHFVSLDTLTRSELASNASPAATLIAPNTVPGP